MRFDFEAQMTVRCDARIETQRLRRHCWISRLVVAVPKSAVLVLFDSHSSSEAALVQALLTDDPPRRTECFDGCYCTASARILPITRDESAFLCLEARGSEHC
jgi:hypothetical protein